MEIVRKSKHLVDSSTLHYTFRGEEYSLRMSLNQIHYNSLRMGMECLNNNKSYAKVVSGKEESKGVTRLRDENF